jgi:ATP-binding cassette, subfamily B, bacterial
MFQFKRFPYFQQRDAMDCGPTCLMMIAAHLGQRYSLPYLRDLCHISREGVSALGITEGAESIGFRAMTVKVPYEAKEEACLLAAPLPCVAHWNQQHFVVIFKATRHHVWIADPANGKFKLKRADFEKSWCSDGQEGVVILLEETPAFYDQNQLNQGLTTHFAYLFQYLRPYRRLIGQVVIGMLLGSLFQLIFPFLTQSVVDIGIQNRNIGFVFMVLFAQTMLFLSQTAVAFLQNRILMHIGTRINVALVTDFLIKLMRLPLGFFDTKMTGDLMQRIGDQSRIEGFLTQSSLAILFSLINFGVFSIVLLFYNLRIFLIFMAAAIIYLLWIAFFLHRRKAIDYIRFQEMSSNQNTLIELIQGMPEIKLQGSERKRRAIWASIQAKLFHISLQSLNLTQMQEAGAAFINQSKDLLISFVAAKAVIDGQMSLGMMLSTQYMVGQLNAPLQQFIAFIRSAQDARISLERLNEIHQQPEEGILRGGNNAQLQQTFEDIVPQQGNISLQKVSFKYNELSEEVLKKVNLTFPKGKVTAIVGSSGSGKTTLVKLLLGFYTPTTGAIRIGNRLLSSITPSVWREHCGAVMQDGFIFSDTIANNIGESDEIINRERLFHAVERANIQDFIETLPLGYNTMIGATGNGISQGQKQRLLIARAVYKNPDFLFFDEATNALDANNERVIVENLNAFFQNRTVIVVAHRLSTVKNADQIVVLERGEVVEIGNHQTLVAQRGPYFNLVKNQLELGN